MHIYTHFQTLNIITLGNTANQRNTKKITPSSTSPIIMLTIHEKCTHAFTWLYCIVVAKKCMAISETINITIYLNVYIYGNINNPKKNSEQDNNNILWPLLVCNSLGRSGVLSLFFFDFSYFNVQVYDPLYRYDAMQAL